MKLRTNKKRNTALLYEFLIKHITKCIIEDKKQEADKCLNICKKFFSEGSHLRSELKLFHSVINSKNVSKESMSKILDYAYKSASLLNSRILDEEKSKLIKEINYNLDKEVYNYKIPDYVNYSSLQLLFNDSRSKMKKLDEVNKIKLQDSLIKKLTESKSAERAMTIKPAYNNTVYKLLVSKFHEKYASSLSENQKKFLVNYVSFLISEDRKSFVEVVKEQVKRINDSLSSPKDKELSKDKVLVSNLKECLVKFNNLKSDFSDDKNILDFLQYIKLADEVDS